MTKEDADNGQEDEIIPEDQANWDDAGRVERLRQASSRVGGHAALVAKSGVSKTTLNRYLKGGELKAGSLVAIANAAGLSIEWLATGKGAKEPGTDDRPTFIVGSPPFDPQQPHRSRLAMFASVDIDRLAAAIVQADASFAARGGQPTPRERAQAVALLYDMLEAYSAGLHDAGKT